MTGFPAEVPFNPEARRSRVNGLTPAGIMQQGVSGRGPGHRDVPRRPETFVRAAFIIASA